MGDWLLNLPIPWMALVIFVAIYLVTAAVYLTVIRLAVGDRARAFKGSRQGWLAIAASGRSDPFLQQAQTRPSTLTECHGETGRFMARQVEAQRSRVQREPFPVIFRLGAATYSDADRCLEQTCSTSTISPSMLRKSLSSLPIAD